MTYLLAYVGVTLLANFLMVVTAKKDYEDRYSDLTRF